MDSTEQVPKETILKSKEKKERKPLSDEAREALAMRMRAINDKRILDTAEKIKKSKPPVPATLIDPVPEPVLPKVVAPPVEVPKPEKKKRVIKVIELSDSEDDVEEQVIAIRKSKAKPPAPKPKEHLEEIPVRKPRIVKPKTPKEPQPAQTIYQMPEPPRGRFL